MRKHLLAVHLSATPGTATQVGARRGAPVVLTVHAAAMHAACHTFYQAANGICLMPGFPRIPRFHARGCAAHP